MKGKKNTKNAKNAKKCLRMMKRECRLAWALALGLAVLPLAGRAYAADDAYGTWSDTESAYVVTVGSSDSYADVFGYHASKSSGGSTTVGIANVTGGTIMGKVYGGYSSSGAASGNKVVMSGGTVGELTTDSSSSSDDDHIVYNVYGGYSTASGGASNNTVVITGGTVYGYVAGAYVYTDSNTAGNADNNTVTISATDGNVVIYNYVYGGKSKISGNASGNSVVLGSESTGSTSSSYTVTLSNHVYGGKAKSGNVIGNSVKILSDNVTLTGSVYAGYTDTGNAQANSITLAAGTVTGEKIGDMYGNYTSSSETTYYACGIDADGNVVTTVTVTGGTANTITAGFSKGGTAYANSVVISGGTINSTVRGNRTDTGTATGNYTDSSGNTVNLTAVTVTGGTLGSTLYGGYANSSGTAVANAVVITGGTVSGKITGGYTDTGTAEGNSVSISTTTTDDGTVSPTIGGDVYGNYAKSSGSAYGYYTDSGGTVTVTSVTIDGATVSGSVYGGYSASGTAAGNSVTMSSGTIGDSTDGANQNIYGNYSESGAAIGYYTVTDSDGNSSKVTVASVTMTGGTVENTVYGGKGASADGNSVSISGDAQVGLYVVGGEATGDTTDTATCSATDNSVALSGNAIIGIYSKNYTSDSGSYIADDADVIGGWATGNSSSATGNSVTISGSVYIYGNAIGAYGTGTVSGNSVTMTGGTVSGNVEGGYSASSTATVTENTVTLSGSAIVNNQVIGGYNAYEEGAEVSENTVKISESAYANTVVGGHSYGNTTGNAVTITGNGSGSNNAVYVMGGWSFSGSATGNTVSISDSVIGLYYDDSYVDGYAYVYGGYSSSGAASGNSVALSSATVHGSVVGNYATSGAASGDYTVTDSETGESTVATAAVTIVDSTIGSSDSSVSANVYGNYSYSGDATGSASETDVTITSSTVYGSVYGGYAGGSAGGSATGNSVSLSGTSDSKTSVTGDVYGGYSSSSGTTTGNAVSLNGYVSVTGTVYGGSSASSATTDSTESTDSSESDESSTESSESVYNTLWVAGTENYAATLKNFDTITFDITGLENGDTMLTLSAETTDLTGASWIGLYQDNSGIASKLGEVLYLIDTNGSISVTADSLQELEGYITVALNEDYDTAYGTSYINDGASLTGETYREIMVVTETDGTLTAAEADEDGVITGEDLVLRIGDTLYVTDVDFNITDDDGGVTTVTWGDSTRITLVSGTNYVFYTETEAEESDEGSTESTESTKTYATVESISDITVDGVSGTLIADDDTTLLMDGSGAASVTALGDVDLDSVNGDGIAISYTPASGVAVTGTSYVDTATLTDGGTDADSLVLVSDSIDSITFTAITYDAENALITLDGTSTYDMSGTEIDVSELTLVDNGGTITPTVNEENVEEVVMTLISSEGSVTNLGQNEDVNGGADISEEQEFGYLLIGTDSDGNATGATLTGTLVGYVISESSDSSSGDSESGSELSTLSVASEDGTEETSTDTTDTYDLVLRTGTTVTVTEVELDISSLDAESDAQLTLSPLSYDFTELASDGISITGADGETEIENATTLIDSITLIDGSAAADVTGMGVLAGYGSEYSYSIGDSIDVTGEGTTVISADGRTLTYDILNILTLDFWIDEDTSTDEPMLTVETADLSGTEVTAHAKDGDYLKDGYEVVLIEATEEDGLTTDDETTYAGEIYDGVSVEYELEVAKEGDTIVARIIGTGDGGSAELREETESLPQTRLVQSAIIDAGTDQLVLAFDDAFMTVRERTKWTPYIAMSIGDFEFSSGHGGKLDLESFNATVGLLRNYFKDDGVFSWGPVFQYGHADYDSSIGSVTASGESEHSGGGLFARRRWNSGLYIEGAVTGGYSEADYASGTLLSGTKSSFSVGSPYWSVYAGLAKDYTNSHGRTFKPYVRYYYSRLDDADARLSSGELYRFSGVDSSRLRTGFRVTWDLNADEPEKKGTGFAYLGAAFHYQFDGGAVGVYNGMSTREPSFEGGSAIIEGGLRFSPKESAVTVDVGAAAWSGAQQGVEGTLKIKWDL